MSNVTFLYHTSEIFRRYKKVALGINGFTHFHEVFLQKQSSWLAQANYVTKYLWTSDTWEKMHNLYLYLKLYFFTGFFFTKLASANQLPGFYISGKSDGNGLKHVSLLLQIAEIKEISKRSIKWKQKKEIETLYNQV